MSFDKVDLASRKSSTFFGFQNVAMACSPFYIFQNPIISTEAIYTGPVVQFNDTLNLVAGDTITKIFNYSDTYYGIDRPEPLKTLGDRQLEVSADILITFNRTNRDSLDFQFELITTLTDGEVFKSEGLAVKLLPSR